MRKIALFLLPIFLVSCASTMQSKEKLSKEATTPLMQKIYGQNQTSMPRHRKIESIAKINEPYYQTLNSPLYVKVYHGSYKDRQGNVISGGFMWLKLSSGLPKTNF